MLYYYFEDKTYTKNQLTLLIILLSSYQTHTQTQTQFPTDKGSFLRNFKDDL